MREMVPIHRRCNHVARAIGIARRVINKDLKPANAINVDRIPGKQRSGEQQLPAIVESPNLSDPEELVSEGLHMPSDAAVVMPA